MSSSVSRREIGTLVAIHSLCAVLLAPSGLVVPFRPYVSLWTAWSICALLVWSGRRSALVVPGLLAADLALLVTAFFVLPGVTVSP